MAIEYALGVAAVYSARAHGGWHDDDLRHHFNADAIDTRRPRPGEPGMDCRTELRRRIAILVLAAGCTGENQADSQSALANRSEGDTHVPRTRCDSTATCFIDTATVVELPHEPGRDVRAHWLLFAAAGDSLELRVTPSVPDLHAAITLSRGRTPPVQERDSAGNTASYVRFRLSEAATITAYISMDDGLRDTVEYTLAVRRMPAPATPRPPLAGGAAGLTLSSGRESDEFILRPLSFAASHEDSGNWTVFPGRYKVALAADSQYVICRAPCTTRDTVTLRAREHTTRAY